VTCGNASRIAAPPTWPLIGAASEQVLGGPERAAWAERPGAVWRQLDSLAEER
jgi:hypothetical protein